MEYGIAMAPRMDIHKLVAKAEDMGYSYAWLYDIPTLYPDVYMAMTLCAQHTSRIKIGPGVAVPGSRTALQTANALASVNRIAPGRVVYGIGTGHTARRTMGLPPMRLSEFGQYVRDVQALLNGERVRVRANGDESTGQFIYPAQVHMNLDDHIPIYVSAWGPRALELAGEVGDAVFVRGSYRGAEQVRQGLEKGAVKAGRRAEDIPQAALLYFYILGPGEDPASDAARSYMAPLLFANIDYLAWAVKDFDSINPVMGQALKNYWKVLERFPKEERHLVGFWGHTTAVKEEFLAEVITPDLLRSAKSVLEPDQARQLVQRLAEAGVGHIAYQVAGDEEEAARRFADEIIAKV